MIIYIDIIFIENIIMNTIILYATAIILKQKVKNKRKRWTPATKAAASSKRWAMAICALLAAICSTWA